MARVQRANALAVDDDPSFLHGLHMMLRLSGFSEIESVGDVDAAWSLLVDKQFDIVVCDWNMDPYDGLELLRRVRADNRTARTPFILVTASLSEEAWRGAIISGATDFIRKPFSLDQLRSAVNLALSMHPPVERNVVNLPVRQRAQG